MASNNNTKTNTQAGECMKIIKWILISILGTILMFLMMAGYLFLIRVNDYRLENRHHKRLISYYENDYVSINESDFLDFDITDTSIALSDIQILATHNSYKKTGPALGRFFVGLGADFDEARSLKYGYLPLTDQFERGIRSMEFDIRLRNNRYEITHVPLVDSSSVSVTLKGALEEIKLYSIHNPDHVPMIFLLEIKDDWMMLDPKLNEIDGQALIKLNDLITTHMGAYLISPKDVMEPNMTLRESLIEFGWPSVYALRGKSIFVIHPGKYSTLFDETFTNHQDLSVFIGAYHDQQDKDYASFFVHNTPDIEIISGLVNQNFIVRTRIDSGLVFSQERMQLAIDSGAQILTSDFTNGRSDVNIQDVIYLKNNKMVVKKT
jgi:hypothetical protein